MAQQHKINGRLRTKPSLAQNQQQQIKQTRSHWIGLRFNTFKNLAESDRSKNFFDVYIWLSNQQQILDILVPQAEAARFLLVREQSLYQKVVKAGFTELRLLFVAPRFINKGLADK
jgi:hypothetical protein